jgi:hypothetical protein
VIGPYAVEYDKGIAVTVTSYHYPGSIQLSCTRVMMVGPLSSNSVVPARQNDMTHTAKTLMTVLQKMLPTCII